MSFIRIVCSSVLLLLCSFVAMRCSGPRIQSDSKPIDHALWTSLLQEYVSDDGHVDYKGFVADSLALNKYLDTLSKNHPNKKYWSTDEQLAYWINAYNAFTVRLIIRNYPVESIKDLGGSIYRINTAWDIKFIEIEGETYDLNNIEHDILRGKFEEPRIHFAVNCASKSCPPLMNIAFEADQLDMQLDSVAQSFIRGSRNDIAPEKAELSRIFKWFNGDFTENMTLIEFINQYSEVQLEPDADITYKEYDWSLND